MNPNKASVALFKTLIFSVLYTSLHCQNNARLNNFSIDYSADKCNITQQHFRHYINDTVYVDSFENVIDTFIVNEGKISIIKRNIPYVIADLDRDTTKSAYHYYYMNRNGYDTVMLKNENELYYNLRLDQSINIFKQFKTDTLDAGRVIYAYYVFGNCYPISERCIKSKIANEQYGIVYFERSIGVAGNAASNKRCIYLINSKSYSRLLAYINHKR